MSINWIVNRLREPSTWRGLVWLATAAGVSLSPELWESITAVGMAVAGLIGVISREEPTRVDIHLPPPIELIGRAGVADGADPVVDRRAAADQLRQSVPPGSHPDPSRPVADDFPGWGS